jgi:hypothetical protein
MLLALLALIALLLPSLAFLSLLLYITTHRAPRTTSRASLGRSAAVVVLGDVARSPRMCYHVQSLAHEGWKVALVGYGGECSAVQTKRRHWWCRGKAWRAGARAKVARTCEACCMLHVSHPLHTRHLWARGVALGWP